VLTRFILSTIFQYGVRFSSIAGVFRALSTGPRLTYLTVLGNGSALLLMEESRFITYAYVERTAFGGNLAEKSLAIDGQVRPFVNIKPLPYPVSTRHHAG